MELVRRENVRQASGEDSLQELGFQLCLVQFGKGEVQQKKLQCMDLQQSLIFELSSCYINGYKYTERKDLAYLNDLKSL